MRKFIVAALLSFVGAAPALAEDAAAYRAAKAKAVAEVAKMEKSGKFDDARQTALLKDLEKRLMAIVAPVSVAGFEPQGKISLEALSSGEIGGDALDGINFLGAGGGAASLLETTKPLAGAWLKGLKIDANLRKKIPNDLKAALRSADFYTFAISPDAAVSTYGDVAIASPAGADALALFSARSQDQTPPAPTELIVAVFVGERLFIAAEPLSEKISGVPECEKQAATTMEKARAKQAAYEAGGAKNEKLFSEYQALEAKSAEDNRLCFIAKAKGQPFYATARAQAEALAAKLAAAAK